MSDWFIVTSACNVQYGIFDIEERFNQTIETLKSIKQHIPDSKIVLLESSPMTLSQEKQLLFSSYTDLYVDYSNDDLIQTFHKTLNLSFLKSISETYIVGSFLETQNIFTDQDRIFKLSGRYVLSDKFNRADHNKVGKYVFKNKQPFVSYYYPDSKLIINPVSLFQYKTRLYSLCGSLIGSYIYVCKEMFSFFNECYQKKVFTDIEHVLYKFMNHSLVEEIPVLGIKGMMVDRDGVFEE